MVLRRSSGRPDEKAKTKQVQLEEQRIALVLDKPSYPAGAVVQGVACVTAGPSGLSTSGVSLKIRGLERCQWVTQHSVFDVKDAEDRSYVSGSEFFSITHGGRRTLLNAKIELCPAQDLPPGLHLLPFTFALPGDLPATFSCSAHFEGYRAEIAYRLVAVCSLLKNGHKAGSMHSTIELPVTVRAAAWGGSSKPPRRTATAEVTTCGCFRHGVATGEAQLEGEAPRPGEVVPLVLKVHNQSTAPLRSVRVRLLRHLHLQGTDSAFKEGGNFADITVKLLATSVPGFAKGEDGLRQVHVQLPDDVEPTAEGQLIRCSHSLEVVVNARCGRVPLKMCLPLDIRPPPAAPQWWQDLHLQRPPPEWQPVSVSPPTVFHFQGSPPVPAEELLAPNQFWRRLVAALPQHVHEAAGTFGVSGDAGDCPLADHLLERGNSLQRFQSGSVHSVGPMPEPGSPLSAAVEAATAAAFQAELPAGAQPAAPAGPVRTEGSSVRSGERAPWLCRDSVDVLAGIF